MGICSSGSANNIGRNPVLEHQLEMDRQRDLELKKLLLLGAGESGKSTLFKQMINCYGDGFSEADRMSFTTVVHANTLGAMATLMRKVDEYAASDPSYGLQTPEAEAAREALFEAGTDAAVDAALAQHIKTLWSDEGVQRVYARKSEFQMPDSAPYFFGRVDDMAMPEYIPSRQDVLRTRVRTTGIVETSFTIDGSRFKLFDVGGQRNERKKWIHCFENVTAVIFVAAISEYDQVLYEDHTTNRMDEALSLFDEICNLRWFKDTAIILFLNKRDLFEQKIQQVPLTRCFEHYPHGDSRDPALAFAFLTEEFEKLNRMPNKTIYTHVTCATNKQNIFMVFNSVKDIMVQQSINEILV
ncbi:MAG: hypothetical protein MHM6MM_002075 [Cercozoa sp. M6MM]